MSAPDDKAIEAALQAFWDTETEGSGLDDMRRAIAAYEAAMWQPIESAPSVEEIVAKAERWRALGGSPQVSDDDLLLLIADWRKRGEALVWARELANLIHTRPESGETRTPKWVLKETGDLVARIDAALTRQQPPG